MTIVRTPSRSQPLPYEAAPAESNEGTATIEGAPGWPTFWIPPVKAWREDSRGKAGFADCIEHAAGRPCFSAREPAGHEFRGIHEVRPGSDPNTAAEANRATGGALVRLALAGVGGDATGTLLDVVGWDANIMCYAAPTRELIRVNP
jgi:hypothetical protein